MDAAKIGEILLDILDKYGILGAIIIALCILIFKFGNKLVELLAQRIAEGKLHITHSSARKSRKDSIFKINRILSELIHKLDADRAAIFEYHNGGYNLTGLPFLHVSLSLQRNKLGVDELSKDFDNILVSSIPDFINDIDKNVIHIMMDIDELQYTFPRLHRELVDDGMKSAVFCNLEGVKDQIGFVMITYKDPSKVSRSKITKELLKKTQKMSTLLDYKNVK